MVKQFCPHGHDTFVVGRDYTGWCGECRRLREQRRDAMRHRKHRPTPEARERAATQQLIRLRTDPVFRANRRNLANAHQRKIRAQARAFRAMYEPVQTWWSLIKDALENRTELPDPPVYREAV